MPTVNEIRNRLEKLGFEAYLAKNDHTLLGLKENIFNALGQSEYYLLVDFRREKISEGVFRGSLFTHQELALASLHEIPSLGFQEVGVEREGVLQSIQLNTTQFSTREELPDLIEKEIVNQRWDPSWKNRLDIFRDSEEHDDIGDPALYRVFHVGVRNLHNSRPAINCTVVIERARESSTGRQIAINEMVDVKWTGVTEVSMTISPKAARYFDGCRFYFSQPNVLRFFLASNYGNQINRFENQFLGISEFDICFAVHSENFQTSRAWFRVQSSSKIEDAKFSLIKNDVS